MKSSIAQALWNRGFSKRGMLFSRAPLAFVGLLLLTSCGLPANGDAPGSTSIIQAGNQSATNSVTGALTKVRMIDANIGWAMGWDLAGSGAYQILRTTDGGRHWKMLLQCFPMSGLGKGENCSADFRSAKVATVVEPDYARQTLRIFHTSDGGQTWQRSVIAAVDLETPAVFVDGLHGWVFATDHFPGPDAGSAYIGGDIALYRTSDGGASWQRIASGPSTSQITATTDDAYGIPPFAASARLQFVTPSTGWLIGSSSRPDLASNSWLYMTQDGGNSWRQVALSFPDEALALWPPTFFTERVGVFPILTSGPAPQYVRGTLIFSTRDGGQTWTSAAVPKDVTNATFLDLQHAVAFDADTKALIATNDGWNHWTSTPIPTTFTRMYAFDFVSPTLGWALADNHIILRPEPGGGIRKGGKIALLHTTDGGQTWQEIAHSVM